MNRRTALTHNVQDPPEEDARTHQDGKKKEEEKLIASAINAIEREKNEISLEKARLQIDLEEMRKAVAGTLHSHMDVHSHTCMHAR